MSYARVAAALGASSGWMICILFAVDLVRPEIIVTVDSDVVRTRFAIISETLLSRQGRVLVTPAIFQVRSESLQAGYAQPDSEQRETPE